MTENYLKQFNNYRIKLQNSFNDRKSYPAYKRCVEYLEKLEHLKAHIFEKWKKEDGNETLDTCHFFALRLGYYRKELDKLKEYMIHEECLRIRDVKSCKECSRRFGKGCRLSLMNINDELLMRYWNATS